MGAIVGVEAVPELEVYGDADMEGATGEVGVGDAGAVGMGVRADGAASWTMDSLDPRCLTGESGLE